MSETESDGDEDLRRAIALSLEEIDDPHAKSAAQSVGGETEIIDLLSSDEDNDDLDKPTVQKRKVNSMSSTKNKSITGELADNAPQPHQGKPPDLHPERASPVINDALSGTTGNVFSDSLFSRLDRRAMEAERLARTQKRKASISPPSSRNENGRHVRAKISTSPNSLSRGSTATMISNLKTPKGCTTETRPDVMSYKQQQQAVSASGVQYPKGVVKKTWAHGYPRENDIKIEEVLQKDDLDLAVLSAFQWDDEWVASKINMRRTKLICVVQSQDEQHRSFMRDNSPPNIQYCFPNMEGINIMHSKLQLLSHPSHLRIVIPSANLVPYDWGEQGGIMENTVFLIDLPRLPHDRETLPKDLTFFGKELMRFLKAMGLSEKTSNSILKFDFTETCKIAFIHSIGGIHASTDCTTTGYAGLGTAVRQLGLATQGSLEIDCVSASIGHLNQGFLRVMYLAARGENGLAEYNCRIDRSKSKKDKIEEESRLFGSIADHFRIYYPTRQTVVESKGGRGAGGTICFQPRWYDNPAFPRSLFRDCHSTRNGLLMHNKMLFVRSQELPLPGKPAAAAAWAYLGSANLSESAWGKITQDRATKEPKMTCKNWECGILIPATHNATKDTEKAGSTRLEKAGDNDSRAVIPGMDVFDGVVPVPMVVPGKRYGDRRPWFNME